MAKEQPPEKLTLDKKYRPPGFEYMFGNAKTIAAIQAVLNREQPFPGTIFLKGPSGCGKTSLARIIAGALGATGRDLKQYNISNMTSVDTARSIIDLVSVRPWGGSRVIILNECHMASKAFQNAMLETLEEPPADNYFILCTTEPGKMLKTVRTRSTTYTVELLTAEELETLVNYVAQQEGATLDQRVSREIAKAAEGSPRQALVILDGVIDLGTQEDQIAFARNYYASEDTVADLCQALISKAPWKTVAGIIKGLNKNEPESLRWGVLGYFERILLSGGKQADRVAAMMDFFAANLYSTGRPGLTQACWFALKA